MHTEGNWLQLFNPRPETQSQDCNQLELSLQLLATEDYNQLDQLSEPGQLGHWKCGVSHDMACVWMGKVGGLGNSLTRFPVNKLLK